MIGCDAWRGRVLAGLLAFGALTSASPANAQRSLEVERFDATVRVEESGSISVQEEIRVRFTGSWNGIFRTIPVEFRTPQGFSYRLRLEDVRVTGPDGQAYEFTASRERHYRKLKIRVPDASDAVRTVIVSYRVPNALKFWDEYDELYWNVTGDEWEIPINAATALVVLPASVQGVRTASWTGGYGSTENAASVERDGDAYLFELHQPLSFREGLTVAVAWNPGVVARPTSFDRIVAFIRSNWLLVLPFVSLFGMWRLWYHRGRDPARLSIAPQYEPPEGLTPAEAGTLIDNRPDLRDLTAALVDLAVRGYLRIEEVEPGGLLGRFFAKDDYLLVALKPQQEWASLRAHEQALLEGVFGGSFQGVPEAKRISELQHRFYTNLPRIHGDIFDALVGRGYYDRRPDKVLGMFIGAGVAVGVVGGVGLTFLAERLSLSPLTAILAAVGSALPVLGFGLVMPARTVKGARTLEKVKGFEDFLDRVESDRYRRMITSPQMFEQYLPYAMAFGVEKRWAAAFADLYKDPPSWYVGRWDRGFHPTHFVHSMGQMTTAANMALGSGPRSSGKSGFGGGGGSSGGGFGGGGGGGW